MKKLIVFFLFFFIASGYSFAQLQGTFYTAQDGHIYFKAINVSGGNISVIINAYSSDRTNSESITINDGFILGPTTPWRWFWKKGDYIEVTYPWGQSVYWECPASDNIYNSPSFSGQSGKCNIPGHHCTGFVPLNSDHNLCAVCLSNGYKCHKVNHH